MSLEMSCIYCKISALICFTYVYKGCNKSKVKTEQNKQHMYVSSTAAKTNFGL